MLRLSEGSSLSIKTVPKSSGFVPRRSSTVCILCLCRRHLRLQGHQGTFRATTAKPPPKETFLLLLGTLQAPLRVSLAGSLGLQMSTSCGTEGWVTLALFSQYFEAYRTGILTIKLFRLQNKRSQPFREHFHYFSNPS